MWYYISIPITVVLYVLGLFLLKHFNNKTITNIVFCVLIVLFYLAGVIRSYIVNGLYDWNFTNTLPTANVSPFMFITCPLALVLPKKWREYYKGLISLLAVGMLLSPLLSMIFNGIRNYTFHYFFCFEYLAHILLSLWGCYFVVSKQIELLLKKAVISGSIIVSIAFTMFILNCIFKTSFFGLAITDSYNIYHMKVVSNPYLSAVIYFIGLVGVMVIGYLYQKLIYFLFVKKVEQKKEEF